MDVFERYISYSVGYCYINQMPSPENTPHYRISRSSHSFAYPSFRNRYDSSDLCPTTYLKYMKYTPLPLYELKLIGYTARTVNLHHDIWRIKSANRIRNSGFNEVCFQLDLQDPWLNIIVHYACDWDLLFIIFERNIIIISIWEHILQLVAKMVSRILIIEQKRHHLYII